MTNYSGYLLNKYDILSVIKVLKSKFSNQRQQTPIIKKIK
jgi:hypothetical protein